MNDVNELMESIKSLKLNEIYNNELIRKAIYNNVWFTEKNIADAISEVEKLTEPRKMREISGCFMREKRAPKKIAVVMSGETPLADFRDFLYVLLSGNAFVGKVSRNDPFLLEAYANKLVETCPELKPYISFVDGVIADFDGIILNDNENNHALEEYFKGIPHLFRHANPGLCLLKGDEQQSDLERIAYRCLINFGRGERSVRNLLVPKNYDFQPLLDAFAKWSEIKDHARYFNNYEYRKAAYIVGNVPHIDNGFLILRQSNELNPNVSEIFYHEYESLSEMLTFLQRNEAEDDVLCFLNNI